VDSLVTAFLLCCSHHGSACHHTKLSCRVWNSHCLSLQKFGLFFLLKSRCIENGRVACPGGAKCVISPTCEKGGINQALDSTTGLAVKEYANGTSDELYGLDSASISSIRNQASNGTQSSKKRRPFATIFSQHASWKSGRANTIIASYRLPVRALEMGLQVNARKATCHQPPARPPTMVTSTGTMRAVQ